MRTIAPPAEGYLRIAVVQLDYLPSIDDALEDPLWTRSGAPHSLKPSGGTWPRHLQPKYEALRKRVRSLYVEALRAKLEHILRSCVERKAAVVVLPEYSVPPECLKSLAEGFSELVIVAGSHHVTRESMESGTYRELGVDTNPKRNTNVAPVLNGGKIVAMVPKSSLTAEELNVHEIQPGEDDWAPIELTSAPAKTSPRRVEPFGVLICKDFIHQHNDARHKLVADAQDRYVWLAVPALTPARSTSEVGEFTAHAREQSKRYQKPVALANWSLGGGTCVYRDQSGHAEPEPIDPLPPGLEGVLIVDVDLAQRLSGKSSAYAVRPATKLVSRGTLAYPVVHREQALWLAAFRDLSTADSEEAVDRICDWLDQNPPPVLDHDFTRERSARVMDGKPRWYSVARFEREFGDVVLGPEALPMNLLKAALAQGAVNEVKSWYQSPTSGPCVDAAHVAESLREGAKGVVSRAPVSPEASSAMDAVSARVAPVSSRDAKAFVPLPWLSEKSSQEVQACKLAFERGDFEGASAKARELADVLSEDPHPTPELEERRSQARLIATAALANLGNTDEAKRELQQVTFDRLSRERQIDFVTLSVVLGELDEAEALLVRVNPETEAEKKKWRGAQQSLEFSRGRPVDFEQLEQASVRLRIAALTLERGDFPKALEIMKPLMSLDATSSPEDNSAILFLWTTELTCTALLASAMSERIPWVSNPIPLPYEGRVELVAHLEKAFQRARQLEPSNASSRLAAFEEQFRRATWDGDWLASHVLSAEEQEDERRLEAALSAGRRGDLVGAHQLLESVTPEWRRRLLWGDVLRQVGDLVQAEKLLTESRREFPGRPDVETAFALVAMELERPDEAIAALRAAREALPGVGQRLALAKALFTAGRATEALDELAPLSEDKRPTVAFALARIHDRLLHVTSAIQCYGLYLSQVSDPVVQLRVAELHIGRREVAQGVAASWAAFVAKRAELSVSELRRVAAVQQRNPHQQESAERLKAILSELHARRAQSPEAARAHAELELQRNGPGALSAEDFAELEKAGVVATFEVDDLVQYVQQRSSQLKDITKWQRLGHLGIATALRFTGETNAQYLERAFDAVERAEVQSLEGFWFSPPVTLASVEPGRLTGAEIVVGALEFTFLVRLELLEPLRVALGETGCLVMPIEEWQLLIVEGEREPATSHIEAFARCAEALSEDADQEKTGLHLKDGGWVELSASAVRGWLSREGLISPQLASPANGDEVGPPEDQAVLPPSSEVDGVLLDIESAQYLSEQGELHSLSKAIAAVRLVKGTGSHLRAAQRQQRMIAAASELAKRTVLCAARSEQEGWLRFVEFERQDIPAPQTKANAPSVFAKDVERALRSAALVLKAESCLRIVVDNRLRRLTIDPRVISYWEWPRAEYLRALDRLHSAAERDIGLPQLVKCLVSEPARLPVVLKRLSELGFVDALDADGVVELHSRYRAAGGVNSPVGRVHLDGFEQLAACVGHAYRYEAGQGLALAYGIAIFQVWCEPAEGSASTWGVESKREFTKTLLDRLDSLDFHSQLSTFESALNNMLQAVVHSPTSSWVKATEETLKTSPDSPAALLFREVLGSCRTMHRATACARALSRAWCWIAHNPTGPERRHVGALWQLTLAATGADSVAPTLPTDLRAAFGTVVKTLSILSALWPSDQRPLTNTQVVPDSPGSDIEHILQYGAHALEDPVASGLSATLVDITIPLEPFGGRKYYDARVEALLLRARPEVAAELSKQLMGMQGGCDGETYALLRSFAEDPSSPERRSALALHSVQSTWHRTIEDPLYLLRWSRNLEYSGAGSSPVEAVSRLLSEPLTWVPDGASIIEHFVRRFSKDGGAWADRIDQYELFGVLGPPGWFAAYQVHQRFRNEEVIDEQVVLAWKRLQTPDEQSVAELYRDVVLLRLAAGQRSEFTWNGTTVDLGEHLAVALTNLVRSLDSQVRRPARTSQKLDLVQTEPQAPGDDSLARHEAALLRWCRGALFGPTGFAPCNQTTILWLTWRFYGWLVHQLRLFRGKRGSRAYFEAVRRLAEAAPTKGEVVDDVLDPTGFDESGSHRLIAIVHALGVGAVTERIDGNVPPAMPSTASLVSHLCELAERATPAGPKGDCLDWRAPHNLPDLAVWVLLIFDEHNLLKLTQHTRLRVLNRLPRQVKELTTGTRDLIQRVLVAYSVCAGEFERDERRAVRDYAMGVDTSEFLTVQSLLVAALFAAGEKDLRELGEERFYTSAALPSESDRSHILAVLLLRGESPETFATRVAELRQGLKDRGVTEEFVLDALGNLVASGDGEHSALARAVLLQLASEPQPASRLLELLEALGMRA